MDRVRTGEFRVKGAPPRAALSNENGVFPVTVIKTRQHLHVISDGIDARGANKDARYLTNSHNGEGNFKGGHLSSVSVASHRDVESAETPLITSPVSDVRRQQNEARARAEDRQLFFQSGRENLAQTRRREQVRDRGGFATGNDECVDRVELLHRSHGRDVGTDALQRRDVFANVTLKGEDADERHYQPRSAKRCSRVAVSAPFIAAPRPVDTFATMAAS